MPCSVPAAVHGVEPDWGACAPGARLILCLRPHQGRSQRGPAQKWRAVATIIAVLVAAYFFEWVRILMAVIFLVSFLHYAWTQLKG